MGETEISWTHKPGTVGRTWNPVQGCRRISAGCERCYAERLAARFAESGWSRGLINLKTKKWNGVVRLAAHKLAEPLGWRKPSTVFVNSMSDLFHDGFSNEQIAAVFGVMAACPQHPGDAATVSAFVAAHLRSSDPVAAAVVPTVAIPTVSSPLIGPLPLTEVERELNDGRRYKINVREGAPGCVVMSLSDENDCAVVGFTPEQWREFARDAAGVDAAAKSVIR